MIRKYIKADTDCIIAIWLKATKLAHPFFTQDFIDAEETNVRDLYLPNVETWVTEYDNGIVGFISLIENEVGALFVDPDYHGQKIGKTLMDKAVLEKGALKVEVFKNNSIGRRFYELFGFRYGHEYIHEQTGEILHHLTYDKK